MTHAPRRQCVACAANLLARCTCVITCDECGHVNHGPQAIPPPPPEGATLPTLGPGDFDQGALFVDTQAGRIAAALERIAAAGRCVVDVEAEPRNGGALRIRITPIGDR